MRAVAFPMRACRIPDLRRVLRKLSLGVLGPQNVRHRANRRLRLGIIVAKQKRLEALTAVVFADTPSAKTAGVVNPGAAVSAESSAEAAAAGQNPAAVHAEAAVAPTTAAPAKPEPGKADKALAALLEEISSMVRTKAVAAWEEAVSALEAAEKAVAEVDAALAQEGAAFWASVVAAKQARDDTAAAVAAGLVEASVLEVLDKYIAAAEAEKAEPWRAYAHSRREEAKASLKAAKERVKALQGVAERLGLVKPQAEVKPAAASAPKAEVAAKKAAPTAKPAAASVKSTGARRPGGHGAMAEAFAEAQRRQEKKLSETAQLLLDGRRLREAISFGQRPSAAQIRAGLEALHRAGRLNDLGKGNLAQIMALAGGTDALIAMYNGLKASPAESREYAAFMVRLEENPNFQTAMYVRGKRTEAVGPDGRTDAER